MYFISCFILLLPRPLSSLHLLHLFHHSLHLVPSFPRSTSTIAFIFSLFCPPSFYFSLFPFLFLLFLILLPSVSLSIATKLINIQLSTIIYHFVASDALLSSYFYYLAFFSIFYSIFYRYPSISSSSSSLKA